MRLLSYEIRHFEWSGANSFIARHAAAVDLAKVIRVMQAQNPKSKVVCIGHSHGGNVTLHAMEHLLPAEQNVEIITLATPYIEVFRRDISLADKHWFLVQVLLSIIISLSYLFPSLAGIFVSNNALLLASPVIFAGCFSSLALFYGLFLTGSIWQSRYAVEGCFRCGCNLSKMPSVSQLTIRSVDDEASFALILGRIGAHLNSLFLGWIRAGWRGATLSTIAFVCVLATLADQRAQAARIVCVLMILVTLVGPVVAAMSRATAGRELLLAGAGYEIAINSSPDSISGLDVVDRYPEVATATLVEMRGEEFFRHFIYECSLCPEMIAIWLNRHRLREIRAERNTQALIQGA